MDDLFKNPFVALVLLIGALLAIRFVFSLVVSLFWLIIIGVVVFFLINKPFRNLVMKYVKRIFIKD